jgi:hypothetical protein
MTMKMLLTTVVMLALAVTAAQAGLDPNTDSFGVYYDMAGNTISRSVPVFHLYDAYLLVANPSAAIDGFECAVTRSGAPHFVLSTDLGTDATDEDTASDVYRVQRASPYPGASGAIVLVHWQLLQQAATPMFFYIGPAEPASLPGAIAVLRNGGALRLGWSLSGSPTLPVACVNWYCIAEEHSSFGAVKSLFR